jgi:hypothetical protein
LHHRRVDLYSINPTPSSDSRLTPNAGQGIASGILMAALGQVVYVFADAPIVVS